MFHLMVADGATIGEISYETDRAKFIGRGRTTANPEAHSKALSGTDGSVFDPIEAIRCRVTLDPEEVEVDRDGDALLDGGVLDRVPGRLLLREDDIPPIHLDLDGLLLDVRFHFFAPFSGTNAGSEVERCSTIRTR